jgi:crotonobetainyl-CoA:carnitine CoA-transferase CaiB-like acyl-CoA transferase
MYRLPLSGIRVLDLTMAWAGPYATRLLGDMGAEVIKIEAPKNWDAIRALHLLGRGAERGYNKGGFFNHLNRNKLGCALDLSHPRGRELFLKLVARSDAVIENYRADVMDGLNLSYDVLRQARPDIILVSMPAHGKDGPEAGHIAYGTHVEQLAGLVSLTGYHDRGPHKSGISYGDPVAGIAAAAALCAALIHRRRTGQGRWVEVAQRESMTSLIGEFFVGFSMNGRQPPLLGNRHRSMAPHGCYPCLPARLSGRQAGRPAVGDPPDAGWLAIAVGSDAEFEALCRVIGRPELAADPRFADVVSRYRYQDELDEAISAWTREQSPQEAALALQRAGVAASPVPSVVDLMEDPHLRERGFFERTAHGEAGVWEMDGVPWRLSLTPAHVRLNAPCFAEHNDYVFHHLLGLSDEQVAELERQGVTGRELDDTVHL